MLFIQYPPCSTCQKAKKWLEDNKIEYSERHIATDNPTYDELKNWHEKSGLPLKKLKAMSFGDAPIWHQCSYTTGLL